MDDSLQEYTQYYSQQYSQQSSQQYSQQYIQQFIQRQSEIFNQFRYSLTPEDTLYMFKNGLIHRKQIEKYLFPTADPTICFNSPAWLFSVSKIAGLVGINTHLTCSNPEQWRIKSFYTKDTDIDYGVVLDTSFENKIMCVLYEEQPLEIGNWFCIVGCNNDGELTQHPEFYALISITRSIKGYGIGDIRIYTSYSLENIQNYAIKYEQEIANNDYISEDIDEIFDYDLDDFDLTRHIIVNGCDIVI